MRVHILITVLVLASATGVSGCSRLLGPPPQAGETGPPPGGNRPPRAAAPPATPPSGATPAVEPVPATTLPPAGEAAPAAAPSPSPPPPPDSPPAEPPAPEPAPAVQVVLEPAEVAQGRWLLVRVHHAPGPVTGEIDQIGPLQFYQQGSEWRALAAVPAAARPGTRAVSLSWPDGGWQGELKVASYPFPEDRITVTASQAASLDDPRAAEEALLLRKLRSQGGGPPMWRAPFGLPLATENPRITTQFGEIRYVNGRWTGQHSGLDFGAGEGTPVLAPAPGRVVLARELVITGNTVLLDHGGNLFSLYGHLSALSVAEGEEVRRGQALGAVGNTGLSTGPHLHWSVYVGNVPTDPWQATGSGLPLPVPAGYSPD